MIKATIISAVSTCTSCFIILSCWNSGFFLHFRVAEYIPPRPLFPKRTDGAQRVSKPSEIHVQLQPHILTSVLWYIIYIDNIVFRYDTLIYRAFRLCTCTMYICLFLACFPCFAVYCYCRNTVICSLSIHVDFVWFQFDWLQCFFPQAVEDFHNQVGSVANLILDEFRYFTIN